MNDRLHDFDLTHAMFAAMGSVWWRILAFFVCCCLGHFIGVNCAGAADYFGKVWTIGPSAIFDHSDFELILIPLAWLGTLIVGCHDGWGVIQLFVLGAGLLFVWLSQDRLIHGLGLAALSQPVDSFFVAVPHTLPALAVGLVALVFWEAFVAGVYWWCWQQIE